MRIGAAQDMMIAGFDTIGIMQAGGWRTSAVLARYVENAASKSMHLRRWQNLEANANTSPPYMQREFD
jgi:hypothetical protein